MIRRKLGLIFLSIILGFLFLNPKGWTQDKPYIDSLSPNKGPVDTEVAILGSGFGQEKGKVIFYKNQTASILSWKEKEIICQVPAKAKSGSVIVMDKDGHKSNSIKFKVLTGILVAPGGLKTENITATSATFKWNPIKGASGYTISLGTDAAATNLKSVNIKATSYDKSGLEPNKTYYWKVKALHQEVKKNSNWSRVVSFKTKAEEVPVAPTTSSEEQKKTTNLGTFLILAAVIFVVLLLIFILVRFLLRRRSLSLEEPELGAEPGETPPGEMKPPEESLGETPPPSPRLDNISHREPPSTPGVPRIEEPPPGPSTFEPPSEPPPSEPPPSEPPPSEPSSESPEEPSSGAGF